MSFISRISRTLLLLILVFSATSVVFAEANPGPKESLSAIKPSSGVTGKEIVEYARNFLGRPYRSGSKGPKAFDCSGFTSYVFRNFDLKLGASSRDQYRQGQPVAKEDLQPGDLLFFSGSRRGSTVGHVGIVTEVKANGSVTFIHAACKGGIRYDSYPDGGYYSNRYIGAKRVH